MAPARFFAYIFFLASKRNRCTEEEKDVQVSSFFEQWMNTHQLKEESVFDLGHPDLTLARIAEKEGHSVAVLHFDDIDILEIERRQILPDEDPFAFWEKCGNDLEACRVGGCYFGTAHALSFPSDEIFKESIREMAHAEIPGTGFLYRMGAHSFLMISQKPAEFLGRDFPAIASIVQKLAFQEDVSKEVKRKSKGYRREIERLISPERLKDIETNFNAVKKDQTYLQDNLISLSKVRENFDINILSLRNYLKTLDIRTDTLFAPVIRKAGKARQQLNFDMNHARLNLDRVNGQLKLLELGIEKQRINEQSRINQLITVIGVTFSMGQVAANEDWDVKLLLMCVAMLVISLIVWFMKKGK